MISDLVNDLRQFPTNLRSDRTTPHRRSCQRASTSAWQTLRSSRTSRPPSRLCHFSRRSSGCTRSLALWSLTSLSSRPIWRYIFFSRKLFFLILLSLRRSTMALCKRLHGNGWDRLIPMIMIMIIFPVDNDNDNFSPLIIMIMMILPHWTHDNDNSSLLNTWHFSRSDRWKQAVAQFSPTLGSGCLCWRLSTKTQQLW